MKPRYKKHDGVLVPEAWKPKVKTYDPSKIRLSIGDVEVETIPASDLEFDYSPPGTQLITRGVHYTDLLPEDDDS